MKPYYERAGIVLFCGDCREVSPTLTERGIVIFDAPYSEHTHAKARSGRMKGDGGSFVRNTDLGFVALSGELREHLARESARLATRWVLSFSDVESLGMWRNSLTAAGLDYVRTAAWRKIGATPQFSGDRPAIGFETITIAHPRGRKRWNGGGRHGWWDVPDPWSDDLAEFDADLVYEETTVRSEGMSGGKGEPRIHETQKPERLMSDLIEDFSDPGELIYDFTAGGATTLVCAHRMGRRAVGIEIREAICEKAARRIDCAIDGRGYYAEERAKKSGQGAFTFEVPK